MLLKSVRLDIAATCCSQKSLSCMFELTEGWDIRDSGFVSCAMLTDGINCVWSQHTGWLTCPVHILAWVLTMLSKALVVFLRPCSCWFSIFISSLYTNHPIILCCIFCVTDTFIKQNTHKTYLDVAYLLRTSCAVIQIKRLPMRTVVQRTPSCL